MSALRDTWTRLKSWQGGVWLPVLPPLGALVELAVLVAIIEFADWVMPGVDLASLEPSPYWIPVLLLSLQYGTVAGLMAAAAATLAHIFNGFPDQGIDENLFAFLLRIWALPILWIGVSLLVGQFRLRQIEVKQELSHQLTERSKERDSLAEYAAGLERRCTRLERGIATRASVSGTAVLDALSYLERPSVDLSDVLSAVGHEAFPGAALSVFMLTANGLEVIARCNWGEGWSHEFGPAHPLYRAIAGQRRPVSALTKGDEAILLGQGLAAYPIVSPEQGRVTGMVKLDHASPELITPETQDRLAVIARLIAPRLAEPRIAVGNAERGSIQGDTVVTRLTRGWRQLSWSGARTGADADGTVSAGSSAPQKDVLPRLHK